MVKNITIFTTSTCPSCVMVKRYLDMKGLNYDVVNLDEKPERRAEVIEKSRTYTVPVTIVTKTDDSEEVVVGYNLQRLAPVIG